MTKDKESIAQEAQDDRDKEEKDFWRKWKYQIYGIILVSALFIRMLFRYWADN